ncbi:tyrosine protein kinase [Gordonia bronchialis DSM 43247]|uniref:non-specific serine/threonine protein kinase n=1 Tax=Gordonia bronchialis (strain ATCC 25592 / DSM 43247 / BCRC 13721 / JCM 3198 / KCTC 3076 / NBRC 16047 / NCTC 10667) TaxID=526226 RepID=D0L6X0_GORB4|nr:protein kinase [Gordonia bronchialis]ACY20755.1 tyrosine protein kinase [Gordonia bronchialis DSM 43247]MCC3323529.1 protein kinase [Gordonia bronchialis]UAK38073.1 protein kinase [Gordonia bronchialis]STQ63588.1 Serine/threonine-protein kinase pknF [Gordonia bronchialis]
MSPGTIVSGHRIEAVLRHDASGITYRATGQRGPVDLTVLPADLSADPDFRRRFGRALDIAVRLRHPHLADVLGHGNDNGRLWIATTRLPGDTAGQLLRARPDGLDDASAVHIIADVGAGLDSAHRKGLVHRNVRPDTIVVAEADGTPHAVLTGFGLSRTADDARYHPANDIHSLVYTLVELLTGSAPVPDQPLPERISPALRVVIERALGGERNLRYRTCTEFTRAAELAITLSRPGSESAGQPSAGRSPGSSGSNAEEDAPATEIFDDPTIRARRLFTPRASPDRPTEVVTDRRAALQKNVAGPGPQPQPHRAARPTATPRRGRLRKAVVPILAVLAVVAVVVGGLVYLGSRNAPPGWSSAAQPIADTFPDLLPSRPGEQGWRDAGCKETTKDSVVGITCINPDNLTFVVWHTRTEAGHAAVVDDLPNRPGMARSWDEGPVFASPDTVSHGWVVTDFNDDKRRPYTVVTTWPGHTGRQVLDDWWQSAPFGS